MEEEQTTHHPNYVVVWIVLMVVMGIQFVMGESGLADQFYIPFVATLFGLSIVKALLVSLYFMHLRFERLLIHSLATVPFYFLLLLWLVLYYDLGT